MKSLTLTLGILITFDGAVQARNTKPADVIVYVVGTNTPPGPVDQGARSTVSWIYNRIGVHLVWRDGEPGMGLIPDNPVVIRVCFTKEGQADATSEALAYTQPFSNGVVTINVLYERISATAGRLSRVQVILAHVFAHEIGHVLQGTNQHAPGGVMKAHWNGDDYAAMERQPLSFTAVDVHLIREGADRRKREQEGSSLVGGAGKQTRHP